MGEFIAKVLAEGRLPNTKTTLYTVPASTTTIVRTLLLVTDDSVNRTVNVYLKKSGSTSRRLLPKNTTATPNRSIEIDINITLAEGDIIEGECEIADIIDYSIFGVEQESIA